MKIKLLVISIIITLFSIGCSSSEETTKRNMDNYKTVKKFVNQVNLDVEKNVSWVNLMPGSSPKFHVSGKLSLLQSEDYSINETELKYIKIFQNDEELYYIMPKVVEENIADVKVLTYSTIKGLAIAANLDRKSPVDFELIFKEGKDELKYRIYDILVEEVH